MIFYDFEVFKHDWLVVFIDTDTRQKSVVINDPESLKKYYEANIKNIWVGFNNQHYDKYIFKGILLGMDPKTINDKIIVDGLDGWQISRAFNKIPMINYDVFTSKSNGLKTLEGFMGNNIKETSVPFNLDRKLTKKEIEETTKYCTWDVENTAEVFMENIDTFNSFLALIQAFPDQCSLFNLKDSSAQLTANILGCERHEWNDEFDFFFLPCLRLKKYKYVQDWFTQFIGQTFNTEAEKKAFYKNTSLTTNIAGVPHTFGFGGCHGAPKDPIYVHGGLFHVDVNNYYPSLLLAYSLVTRAATNDNFKVIYDRRKKLKYKQTHAKDKAEAKQYKKAQLPYKLILNALSGAMKDKNNKAYDPRNNNIMCINGQLILLDLIEHLEVIPGFNLIQSNTDGLIIQIPDTDEAFDMLDDICYEWETRCSTEFCDVLLETDQIKEIYQKDVNNYLWVDLDEGIERKGAYVKELTHLDNDLPIVNKALVDYMAKKIPVEDTINNCDELIMFQKLVMLSYKYEHVEHNGIEYNYKCYRVFASLDPKDGKILKCRAGNNPAKFGNTPDKCFIENGDVHNMPIPAKLDRQYYIDLAKKRLKDFGIKSPQYFY
jgi:DNA polymerase